MAIMHSWSKSCPNKLSSFLLLLVCAPLPVCMSLQYNIVSTQQQLLHFLCRQSADGVSFVNHHSSSTILMVVSRVVAKVAAAIIYYYQKWCAKNASRSGMAVVVCIHQEGYKNMLEMIILSQSNCNQRSFLKCKNRGCKY